MIINGFDELNTPKVQVEEPEEYFKKMDISPKQRKERVETSKELADVMLFLFALLAIEMQANKPNYPLVLRSFKQRFRDVVNRHSRVDDYVENYINEFTGGVFDTTRKYMEAAGVGMNGRTDAGWWTSTDRATAIGENEANIILNHEELLEAIEAGAVAKSWSNVGDNKVRNSHKEVTKEKIPLAEFFAVGKGIMLYPCDWDNNPDECFNCRCSAIYYDEKGNVVKVGQGDRSTKVNKAEQKVQLTENDYTDTIRYNLIAGQYKVTNAQIEDILQNELKEFDFPVKPVYSGQIKSAGKTIITRYRWGTVKEIKSIQIGRQYKDTREALIDTLLHEYLEADIALKSKSDPFFEELFNSTDEKIHKYINDYIKEYFDKKGWNYDLA